MRWILGRREKGYGLDLGLGLALNGLDVNGPARLTPQHVFFSSQIWKGQGEGGEGDWGEREVRKEDARREEEKEDAGEGREDGESGETEGRGRGWA